LWIWYLTFNLPINLHLAAGYTTVVTIGSKVRAINKLDHRTGASSKEIKERVFTRVDPTGARLKGSPNEDWGESVRV